MVHGYCCSAANCRNVYDFDAPSGCVPRFTSIRLALAEIQLQGAISSGEHMTHVVVYPRVPVRALIVLHGVPFAVAMGSFLAISPPMAFPRARCVRKSRPETPAARRQT